MTDEATPLRIGVALTLTGDPGEMLADAKALEAAGADSLWVFPAEEYDMPGGQFRAEGWSSAYVVMAAIAAVTWRVRLVVPRPRTATPDVAVEPGVAHATCARIAQGRLLGRIETVWSDAAPDAARAAFAGAREKRASVECWLRVTFPDGRPAWDEQRRIAADAGATGVVLPNDPRLIDLLRNPDIVEDRSDLKLSFG
jgi:hypothetical protein